MAIEYISDRVSGFALAMDNPTYLPMPGDIVELQCDRCDQTHDYKVEYRHFAVEADPEGEEPFVGIAIGRIDTGRYCHG